MVARANNTLPLDASTYPTFDSVVYVSFGRGYGSGAHLKGTSYILTSAHVVENMGSDVYVAFKRYGPDYYQSGREDIELRNVVSSHIHPLYRAFGSTPEFDIAILKIEGVAPTWSTGYEIFDSPNMYQQEVWFAGYGLQSLGGGIPFEGKTFRKSWGANVTDSIQSVMGNVAPSNWDEQYLSAGSSAGYLNKASSVLVMDFDSGLEIHNAFKFEDRSDWQWRGEMGISAEGLPLPGDSGGPILEKLSNSILGVVTQSYTTYTDMDWTRIGNFGEISVNASPLHSSGWIESISKETITKMRQSHDQKIDHDGVSNHIIGTNDGTQRFHINIGEDWYSSHIYEKNGLIHIDTGKQYITLEGISNIRVKTGSFGFGTDITFSKNGTYVSSAAPKTPLPQTYDFVGTGTELSDSFRDQSDKSEKLYGSTGTDTFIIAQKWYSFHDVELGNTGLIVRAYENDTVDLLIDFERIIFSDKAFAYDVDGVAGQAYRLYKAAFDRAPDLPGLSFWIKTLDGGAALTTAASGFTGSTEFNLSYPAVSDTDFIRLLYENALDRQPDAAGYQFWQEAMGRGLTREGLLIYFSESDENKSNVASLIANGIEYTPFIS